MNDIWQYLRSADRPIVMYGTGNGADKIFDVLDSLGIEVKDIFASDGFIRNRTFHGKKVISYSDILKKYGNDMIILLAFGSDLPEVINRFFALASKHELYAPDVPVVGNKLFDGKFYEMHKSNIDAARKLLADDESRAVYDAVIHYRLSGKIEYLAEHITDLDAVMTGLLHPASYLYTLDIGAYTGDTASALISYAPNIKKIIALEPDSKNFTKLSLSTVFSGKVEPHLAAAWNKREILLFSKGGGRAVRKTDSKKTTEVFAAPADSFLDGRVPDFIKIDAEGAEREAIDGCIGSIKTHSPELQIALYHKSADIFELPLKIHEINPAYRLFIRKFPSVPAWDVNLFALI